MFPTKETLTSPYNCREKQVLKKMQKKHGMAHTYSDIEELLLEDIFTRGNTGLVPCHTLKMICSALSLSACSRSS